MIRILSSSSKLPSNFTTILSKPSKKISTYLSSLKMAKRTSTMCLATQATIAISYETIFQTSSKSSIPIKRDLASRVSSLSTACPSARFTKSGIVYNNIKIALITLKKKVIMYIRKLPLKIRGLESKPGNRANSRSSSLISIVMTHQ